MLNVDVYKISVLLNVEARRYMSVNSNATRTNKKANGGTIKAKGSNERRRTQLVILLNCLRGPRAQ